MLIDKNILALFVKKYMLRPIARCRGGCMWRLHDARYTMQD
jgi:hypothetical protein